MNQKRLKTPRCCRCKRAIYRECWRRGNRLYHEKCAADEIRQRRLAAGLLGWPR